MRRKLHARRAKIVRRRRAAGLAVNYHNILHAYKHEGGLLAPAGGRIHRKKHAKRRIARKKRGGFLPFLPLIAAAVPAVLGAVSGAMDIAERAKRMKAMNAAGSGLRRKRVKTHRKKGGKVHRKVHRKHRGRGAVSDFVGRIPLLGSILGPLTSAIGLGLTSPNNAWYLRQHGRGGMLSRSAIMINRPNPMMMVKYPTHADLAKKGKGVSRRGHYRYVNGKRVHVRGSGVYKKRPAHKKRGGKIHKKRAVHRKRRGGYAIFPWNSNVARIAYRH